MILHLPYIYSFLRAKPTTLDRLMSESSQRYLSAEQPEGLWESPRPQVEQQSVGWQLEQSASPSQTHKLITTHLQASILKQEIYERS